MLTCAPNINVVSERQQTGNLSHDSSIIRAITFLIYWKIIPQLVEIQDSVRNRVRQLSRVSSQQIKRMTC